MNKTRAGEGAGLVGSEENGNSGYIHRPAQTAQAISISEIISEIALRTKTLDDEVEKRACAHYRRQERRTA